MTINILLPKLEKTIWSKVGNKNKVKELLAESLEIGIEVVTKTRSFIVVESESTKYCITGNKDIFDEEVEYVLLANKRPTQENIEDQSLKIKKWVKHPLINGSESPDHVISSWEGRFSFIEEDQESEKPGLRNPQIGALYAILAHFKNPNEKVANVILPTGTGKTETMLGALVANQCNKVLVTVPSDALRTQIFDKFLTLGLLKEFGIVGKETFRPRVGILKQKFENIEELEEFFAECNVIVTTMNVVAGSPEDQQERIAQICSNLFIDEAHHVRASSWDAFREKFSSSKVVQFTATPFRNDRKRIDGKFIFDFSLKEAQRQGYFKKINFLPIREYDVTKVDSVIAQKAVTQLRKDIGNDFPHILMARCSRISRADDILDEYKKIAEDLNPVVVYSGMSDAEKKEILIKLKAGYHKIIVAVDMLGEGFDLPELKIAAFHDIRKSLPITLQFAGRFTRTKYDEKLGEASFIANLADIDVKDELSELYSQNADWNSLLADMSSTHVDDQIDFQAFFEGFQKLSNSSIPLQNIRIPLSGVVYKGKEKKWSPQNFADGLQNYEDSEYKFSDTNREENLLVIITANRKSLDWGDVKEIYELDWRLIVVFWDKDQDLLFINSSDKGTYKNLATKILGTGAEQIKGVDVFKAFSEAKRVKLHNVGLKEFINKNISFRMCTGSSVKEALSAAEKKTGQKSFVFGNGYEMGNKVTLGCSVKGTIWSHSRGDLKRFSEWCTPIGKKLIDPDIDPHEILKDTLIPELVLVRPSLFPVWIDWDDIVYLHPEHKVGLKIDGIEQILTNCELQIIEPSTGGGLFFEIRSENDSIKFEKILYQKKTKDEEFPDFKFINHSNKEVLISLANGVDIKAEDFFYENCPRIWFADGSALTGNEYVQLKHDTPNYSRDSIDVWDWSRTDISSEGQGVDPKQTDSIQWKVLQELKEQDFDLIYDDDGKGEMADLVTIKQYPEKLKVNFYHLKYAKNGKIGNDIQNFYEVCGQAQKSIHWKHKSGKEMFDHLLRRITKRKNEAECSRLEKGTQEKLETLLKMAKKEIPIEFEIFVIQPALSKEKVSESILKLLGATENYLFEFAAIKLNVIGSK